MPHYARLRDLIRFLMTPLNEQGLFALSSDADTGDAESRSFNHAATMDPTNRGGSQSLKQGSQTSEALYSGRKHRSTKLTTEARLH